MLSGGGKQTSEGSLRLESKQNITKVIYDEWLVEHRWNEEIELEFWLNSLDIEALDHVYL